MPKTIYKDPARFYVYAFLRESDNSPYYIGKGTGNRAWTKRRRNGASRPSDDTRIILLKESITEPEAHAEEKRLIAFYGRIDLGNPGILRNRTDGGEGTSGHKHSPETRDKMSASHQNMSQKTRDKISASHQNMSQKNRDKISAAMSGANHPMYGKSHSPETRVKLSAAQSGENNHMYGKSHTPETRLKISLSGTGQKKTPESIAKQWATKKRNREVRSTI